ncbi:MAG: YfiR family protein [Gammaproteobacteria bacterium]|nr:MAG: YfiR family protein [Gammaproteobacteria bacterium]
MHFLLAEAPMARRKITLQMLLSLVISSERAGVFAKSGYQGIFQSFFLKKCIHAPFSVVRIGCLLSTVIFIDLPAAYAQTTAPLYEQKIKAGLVYNLIKYTEWPNTISMQDSKNTDSHNAIVLKVCLFGEDPFDGYLSPLQGRTAQQATIAISHITQIQQAQDCSAVVVNRDQEQQLQSLLQFLQGKNVLTISDISHFAERGGMVELTRQDEKIALHINKNSLDSAKLGIDARMLKLATIVASQGASR